MNGMMVLGPVLLVLMAAGPAMPAADAPGYEVGLDERVPMHIAFAIRSLPARELVVGVPASAEPLLSQAPACSAPLRQIGPGKWIKPDGCTAVTWSASLPPAVGFDASRPVPAWNARARLWLLTGALPWLRYAGQPTAVVHIRARWGAGSLSQETALPGNTSIPVYIVAGKPVRRYAADGVVIAVYGDAPSGPAADRLQHVVASTLARWRRDLLPATARAPARFNYAWFEAGPGAAPGIFASSGSDAILMQYVPDPRAAHPADKLESGMLLTGAHEGFHSLGGGLPGPRPAWVDESIATFFAYRAVRHYLGPGPRALADEFIDAPAEHALLHAQRRLEKGDGSDYETFYTRGSRFWAAIEQVLTVPPNRSGRLAALIRQTRGLQGVDWLDAKSIGATLDTYSNGRAGPIVDCYLIDDACPAAARAGRGG